MYRVVILLMSLLFLPTCKSKLQLKTAKAVSTKQNVGAPEKVPNPDFEFKLTAPETANTTERVECIWSEVPGATTYDLIIAENANCSSILFVVNGIPNTRQEISFSKPGDYYFCLNAYVGSEKISFFQTLRKISIKSAMDVVAPVATIVPATSARRVAYRLPISFAVKFSEAIKPETFTQSDVVQRGTATGVAWRLDRQDELTWLLSAVDASSDGTFIPVLPRDAVTDFANNGNLETQAEDGIELRWLPAPRIAAFTARDLEGGTVTPFTTISPIADNKELLWSLSGSSTDKLQIFPELGEPIDDPSLSSLSARPFPLTPSALSGGLSYKLTATNSVLPNEDIELVQAIGFGGAGPDQARAVIALDDGSVIVGGDFQGSVDFDPGAGIIGRVAAGGVDVYIAKYNASGDLIWVKTFGAGGDDRISSMTKHPDGTVIVGGSFQGSVDFDPPSAIFTGSSVGADDAFLAKFSTDGDLMWVKTFGGPGDDRANAIGVRPDGQIVTTGSFQESVDFDPGATADLKSSAGRRDAFLATFDAGGHYVRVVVWGGTGDDAGTGVAVLPDSTAVVTGQFEGEIDFDPGPGDSFHSAAGDSDAFLLKLDIEGKYVWGKALGGRGKDVGRALAIFADGASVVAGQFQQTLTFSSGSSLKKVSSNGSDDVFLAKYSGDGELLWVKAFGDSDADDVAAVAALPDGTVAVAGGFHGSLRLGLDSDVAMASVGGSDLYFAKFDAAGKAIVAKRLGGPGDDYASACAILPNGDALLAGAFGSSVDFDPGIARRILTSNGEGDSFIAKFESPNVKHLTLRPSGLGFAFGIGSSAINDTIGAIATEANGDIWIAGAFQGLIDFDPGPRAVLLGVDPAEKFYVAKYDSTGQLKWAKGLHASTSLSTISGLKTHDDGSAILVGSFYGTLDVDPATSAGGHASAGGPDGFWVRLDANGNFIDSAQFGGINNERIADVEIFSDGAFILTGDFDGTADFDPGAGTSTLTSKGSSDVFVAKYDKDGAFLWAKAFGGVDFDNPAKIVSYADGSFAVAGNFMNSIDLNPDGPPANVTGNGSYDFFLARFDRSGAYLWGFGIGGSNVEQMRGAAALPDGGVVITGSSFSATLDLDPGAGTTSVATSGSYDMILAKYDANGQFVWGNAMGGPGMDMTWSVAVRADGAIFLSGSFQENCDFDPGAGSALLPNAGGTDGFVAKYDALGNYQWAFNVGSSASDVGRAVAILPDGSLAASGTFSGAMILDQGETNMQFLDSHGGADAYLLRIFDRPNF